MLMFIFSLGAFLYYFIGKIVLPDVYKFAFVGAIYEILWLPMLLLLVLVPIASVLILINKHGNKWRVAGSLLLIGAAIAMLLR